MQAPERDQGDAGHDEQHGDRLQPVVEFLVGELDRVDAATRRVPGLPTGPVPLAAA
jgi:hypothetical protein